MFRPLFLAIFRLYMNLSSSFYSRCGVFFRVWGRGYFVCDRDLVCVSGGCIVHSLILAV